jgi:HEPN domain-containing protein
MILQSGLPLERLALGWPRGNIKLGFVSSKAEGGTVNRAQLRQLAEDRILDAACLLAGSRWAGAYYLAGYAVECGLKACIMAHVEAIGAIFQDRKFSEKCWTHDLEELVKLANLKPTLDVEAAANVVLSANWAVAKDWKETSRYEQKTQPEAQALYDAITHAPDGVLTWIQRYW